MLLFQPPPPKRGRSSEDFLMFCKMILDYENYDDGDSVRYRHTSSPMGGSSGSLGSTGETSMSSFTSIEESDGQEREEQHSDSETVVTGNDKHEKHLHIMRHCLQRKLRLVSALAFKENVSDSSHQ